MMTSIVEGVRGPDPGTFSAHDGLRCVGVRDATHAGGDTW